MALLFAFFWTVTLKASASSGAVYLLRSGVVLAYSLASMGFDRPVITVPEWAANAMVWSHWFSLINVFLFPDPRFQRRKANA
jgi:hypothetical protein